MKRIICACVAFGALAATGALAHAECNALSFDGAGHVRVPHSPSLSLNGPHTVEAWIRPFERNQDRPRIGYPNIVGKRNQNIYPNWVLGLWKDGELYGVADGRWATSKQAIVGKHWIHVAAVFDGDSVRFYINGDPSGTIKASMAGPVNNEAVFVGALGGKRQVFFGDIAAVRVSSKARYVGGFKPEKTLHTDDATVLLFDFAGKKGGDVVVDRSRYGNHGVLSGAARVSGGPECSKGR